MHDLRQEKDDGKEESNIDKSEENGNHDLDEIESKNSNNVSQDSNQEY